MDAIRPLHANAANKLLEGPGGCHQTPSIRLGRFLPTREILARELPELFLKKRPPFSALGLLRHLSNR